MKTLGGVTVLAIFLVTTLATVLPAILPTVFPAVAMAQTRVAPAATCADSLGAGPAFIDDIRRSQLLASAQDRAALLENLDRTARERLVETGRVSMAAWTDALDQHRADVLGATDDRQLFAAVYELLQAAAPGEPWLALYPPEALLTLPSGTFSGIGVLVAESRDHGTLRVTEVVPFGPAERAGVRRGDRIVAVDGVPCPDPGAIRGPTGTLVELTVVRPNGAEEVIGVQRGVLLSATLTLHRSPRNPGVFTLRPLSLLQNEAEGAIRTLSELVRLVEPTGLVLDLRRVRVGSTNGLSLLAGAFVSGPIATYEPYDVADEANSSSDAPADAAGDSLEVYASDLSALRERITELPLVVLVDERTEEEAFVLAAELQRRGRAIVVGRTGAGNTELRADVFVYRGARLNVAVTGPARLPNGVAVTLDSFAPDIPIDQDWPRFAPDDDAFERTALALLAN